MKFPPPFLVSKLNVKKNEKQELCEQSFFFMCPEKKNRKSRVSL